MGKNLKGRELGKGIVQREYVKNGNLEKRGFVDLDAERLTVDEWFEFWMNTFKSHLSPNTLRNYRERYKRNIFPYIGKMKIRDVRAMQIFEMENE